CSVKPCSSTRPLFKFTPSKWLPSTPSSPARPLFSSRSARTLLRRTLVSSSSSALSS
ncbi:unnamed protein product, partial [Parascedosporium putredinis]